EGQTLESADELLIRPPRQGGFEVVIGLSKFPGRDTLRRLAARKDRHVGLQRAFSRFDLAEAEGPRRQGSGESRLCWWRHLLPRSGLVDGRPTRAPPPRFREAPQP